MKRFPSPAPTIGAEVYCLRHMCSTLVVPLADDPPDQMTLPVFDLPPF